MIGCSRMGVKKMMMKKSGERGVVKRSGKEEW